MYGTDAGRTEELRDVVNKNGVDRLGTRNGGVFKPTAEVAYTEVSVHEIELSDTTEQLAMYLVGLNLHEQGTAEHEGREATSQKINFDRLVDRVIDHEAGYGRHSDAEFRKKLLGGRGAYVGVVFGQLPGLEAKGVAHLLV